jgi:DNA polymerase elongation subunit (family B)
LTRPFTQTIIICAGHNGKEFDFPYIARRSLINGLKLPVLLDIAGKKPWEIKHLDTMELWKFGDYKHYTSIALLTEIFNIPTPKDDIDGSDVGRVYWEEKNLSRIVEYCQKDVLAVAQLYLRYKGEKLIDNEDVEIVN